MVQKQKNDHIIWRCINRGKTFNCPATIIQDGDAYRQGSKNHIHAGDPGVHIAVRIKAEAKQTVKDAAFNQPSTELVRNAMRNYADPTAPAASRPNPDYLVRSINRIRQGDRPKDPADLNAELEYDYIDSNAPDFFRKVIRVGDKKHLVFYTDRQLDLLAGAKTWYMDGTFRVVNEPFKQLFSIHAFVRSDDNMKQISLVFAVMSGQSADDNYEVLRHIDRRLPERIAVTRFVADFEVGLWKALRRRFPDIGIHGCAFHWAQAVFRKVQEHGLQTAYNQRGDLHDFVRQLFALPFLPAEHIEDAFQYLEDRASDVLQPVLDYMYSTWIRGPVFRPTNWSVFMMSVRTNNDVEGWHNRFNRQVANRGPVPFYHMITQLFEEAGDIPLQLRLVSEGKLARHQRKKSRQIQGKIFATWADYNNKELSTTRLLRKCASVYSPGVH